MSDLEAAAVRTTPLGDLHHALGARMAPFAGYDMPIHYPAGIIEEHLHTRRAASLFDVSHMGQLVIRGDGRARALESLVPGNIEDLAPGRMRYTMLTDDSGGILDDLIVTNVGSYLFVVANAACKSADVAHIRGALPGGCVLEELDRGLVALQGPQAATTLAELVPGAESLPFMTAAPFDVDGVKLAIMRSGYTGEDGFEISIPAEETEGIARRLLDLPGVEPAGLGARDTLRLEAGLCLHGQDIGPDTTPVEAGLGWTIGRRRRAEGGFPGAGTILEALASGPRRRRVGVRPDGRAPVRSHAEIRSIDGTPIGEITSGSFGPSVGGPVAMGYVPTAAGEVGQEVEVIVRNTPRPARIAALPFVPHRYFKDKGG